MKKIVKLKMKLKKNQKHIENQRIFQFSQKFKNIFQVRIKQLKHQKKNIQKI